jgi:hypothetical protein
MGIYECMYWSLLTAVVDIKWYSFIWVVLTEEYIYTLTTQQDANNKEILIMSILQNKFDILNI